MTYRLEVDVAYNVRARKGERREKGTGRLIKCMIWHGTKEECFEDAHANAAAMGSDGYAEIIAVRGYDYEAYKVNPLKVVPCHSAAGL